jgi:hypothetical protein
MIVKIASTSVALLIMALRQSQDFVKAESVWNSLQQHAMASREKNQSVQKESKNGNKVYDYPRLFVDDTNDNTKGPSPQSSRTTFNSSADVVLSRTSDGNNRKGNGGMMMNKMIDTSTTSPQTQIPSTPPFPSLLSPSADGNRKGGMMDMSKVDTFSPSLSYEPSVSIYPTSDKWKGGMMSKSISKQTPTYSPSLSYEPSVSLLPTPVKEKGMSKKYPSPKEKTSSPTASAVPTATYVPTTTNPMSMGMMSTDVKLSPSPNVMDGGMMSSKGMVPSVSFPPSPAYTIAPTVLSKGGGMMNMKKDKDKGGMSMSKMEKPTKTDPPSLPETLLPTSPPLISPCTLTSICIPMILAGNFIHFHHRQISHLFPRWLASSADI